ncbi:MAG: membrane integrity-associated transporter subunit PqiC [Alphaproteobacteria bacterium]|nr:membrane integrity-associated transporter subunit PqiC [Alphaproteobacteria bacterium]
MSLPPLRICRRWLAGGTVLALAGCASLLVSSPPSNLYRLTAARDFPPGLRQVSSQLMVDLPQTPAGIDTDRIALSKSPLTLDYFANAEWIDRLPELIGNLLLASFENSGRITAVDRNSGGLRADYILRTEIRHFEAIYASTNAPPQVWVEIVARLAAVRQRAIIAEARFEKRVPATANDIPAIVAAFNTATVGVLEEIVVWTLSNPALSQRPVI